MVQSYTVPKNKALEPLPVKSRECIAE
ncbi:hypothetical protein BIW11_08616, partial [Tropilaelaps mercedesae]